MMTPTLRQLLQVLGELGEIHPEMRFGQLIANLSSLVDLNPTAVWDVEDEALLKAATEHLESQVQKMDPATRP